MADISKLLQTFLTLNSLRLSTSSLVRREPNGLILTCLKIGLLVSSRTRASEKLVMLSFCMACSTFLYMTLNIFVVTEDSRISNVTLVIIYKCSDGALRASCNIPGTPQDMVFG